MAFDLVNLVFFAFAALTLLAAVGLLLTRKLVHAAFLLFVVLFGVAAFFVLAGAEFLAVSQVIVYVGGILILIIFGVMLTQRDLLNYGGAGWNRVPLGFVLSLGLGLLLWRVLGRIDWEGLPHYQTEGSEWQNVELIGIQTVTRYVLPFELISIVLLIALVGAAYLARPLAKEEAEVGEE